VSWGDTSSGGSSDAATLAGTTPTAAGLALLDDANAAAQRTTLGLGTISTQSAAAVAITGGSIAAAGSARTTSAGTDTIAATDLGGAVVYGADSTVTITSGLTTGGRVTIGASAGCTLTWSVSGGESISEATTTLAAGEGCTIVKVSATVWRVLRGRLSGWVLVRSLSFDGMTPDVSMSVPCSVTGTSYTVTLSTATGWAGVSGGIEYTPAGAGCDVDVDLDALLGSTWQDGTALCLWDVLVTSCTGGSVIVPARVGGTDVYTIFDAANWTIWVGGASGTSGAADPALQQVLGMAIGTSGGVFYRAETSLAAPSALTTMGQATYTRNSATYPLTGLKWRLGLNESAGTLDITILGLRVYARHGL